MIDAALAVSLSQPATVTSSAGLAVASLASLPMASLAISGLALFVAPGALLLAPFPLRWSERLAFAFAASLALLTATFAVCLLLGTSIAAAPVALAAVTIAVTLVARRVAAHAHDDDVAGSDHSVSVSRLPADAPTLFSRLVLATLPCAFVVAAVSFTPIGSVDRWWYLAYVRGYLDTPVLTLAEPFLGTGQAFARFGMHPWLFGLATWSHLSGVDPVVVYERSAPIVAVLASVSASWALALELFGEGARARLSVLATMLLWSGAMIPVLARAGEDKVLAASALMPLCIAAFLRFVRGGTNDGPSDHARNPQDRVRGDPRALAGLLLLFAAAVATAAVHALAYAFVLVALLPTAALFALRIPSRRRTIGVAVALLLTVALAPALSGIVVRERLHQIGAALATPDHPVVRVHEGRERLLELPAVGFVVQPWLLLHPIVLLALTGPVVLSRRRRDSATDVATTASALSPLTPLPRKGTLLFLAATTVVPLAIAFVPPLPLLAGAIIPPWMVYRVLWLLPVAPLAALTVHALAARFGRGETAAAVMLLALGLPVVADGARGRLVDVRSRLAAPTNEQFRGLAEAVGSLPVDALLVAAPELSERLPAFTARHVVAALDRSTMVFAGSRERGEARLRARAALLAGDEDGFALARDAGLHPTHAVFDPASQRQPPCGSMLYRDGAYALCELASDRGNESPGEILEVATQPAARTVAEADCGKITTAARRNPWTAEAPIAICRIAIPEQWRGRDGLHLMVESETGRATDEFRIAVAAAGNATEQFRAAARTTGGASITLALPPLDADEIEVRIASSFLPQVRPRRVALTAR